MISLFETPSTQKWTQAAPNFHAKIILEGFWRYSLQHRNENNLKFIFFFLIKFIQVILINKIV